MSKKTVKVFLLLCVFWLCMCIVGGVYIYVSSFYTPISFKNETGEVVSAEILIDNKPPITLFNRKVYPNSRVVLGNDYFYPINRIRAEGAIVTNIGYGKNSITTKPFGYTTPNLGYGIEVTLLKSGCVQLCQYNVGIFRNDNKHCEIVPSTQQCVKPPKNSGK